MSFVTEYDELADALQSYYGIWRMYDDDLSVDSNLRCMADYLKEEIGFKQVDYLKHKDSNSVRALILKLGTADIIISVVALTLKKHVYQLQVFNDKQEYNDFIMGYFIQFKPINKYGHNVISVVAINQNHKDKFAVAEMQIDLDRED